MRKFVLGTVIGAGLMYLYIQHGGEIWQRGENKVESVGSMYRGDATKRQAEDALH